MKKKIKQEVAPVSAKERVAPVVHDASFYVSAARGAMDIKDWCSAWGFWGSVLARTTDTTENWEYKQLEKKCYMLMLNRKDKKKAKEDKENRWKKRQDSEESY